MVVATSPTTVAMLDSDMTASAQWLQVHTDQWMATGCNLSHSPFKQGVAGGRLMDSLSACEIDDQAFVAMVERLIRVGEVLPDLLWYHLKNLEKRELVRGIHVEVTLTSSIEHPSVSPVHKKPPLSRAWVSMTTIIFAKG